MARELSSLLEVIFTGLRKSGQFDLEARSVRAAAHQIGVAVLQQLLGRAATSFPGRCPVFVVRNLLSTKCAPGNF